MPAFETYKRMPRTCPQVGLPSDLALSHHSESLLRPVKAYRGSFQARTSSSARYRPHQTALFLRCNTYQVFSSLLLRRSCHPWSGYSHVLVDINDDACVICPAVPFLLHSTHATGERPRSCRETQENGRVSTLEAVAALLWCLEGDDAMFEALLEALKAREDLSRGTAVCAFGP